MEHGIFKQTQDNCLCSLLVVKIVYNAYRFVDRDSDGSLGYIEYNASSAVIVLEGHALVDGGIHFNIYIVTSL